MSDAPERIWVATWREGDWREGDWDDNEGKTLNEKPCIQYVRADRIEALTEQLAAARQDADEAEAYAWKLEEELRTTRMAQAVMDNTVADLEAKLAKAVEALERIAGVKGPYSHPFPESYEGYGAFAIVTSRETLVEIKGESHDVN